MDSPNDDLENKLVWFDMNVIKFFFFFLIGK